MRNRVLPFTIAILALLPLAATGPVFGQAPAARTGGQSGKAWTPPRTADGQPDIQGFWTEEAGGPEAVNVETALQTAESLRIQGWTEERLKARKPVSSIVDPPDGRIPYQPWAEARRRQILSRYGGDEITDSPKTIRDVSPELVCIIGTPRAVFFADFQVLQSPGVIVMAWERSGEYRVIPLNSTRPRLPQNVKLHMGDARGRWEGNTLIVETSNLNDWSWFDSKGTPHSDAMTLVERFTFNDEKTMDYRVTVTDPKVLTRPFTMGFTLKRNHMPGDGHEILETACVEGERSLGTVLGQH
jgi:hypothetical protein